MASALIGLGFGFLLRELGFLLRGGVLHPRTSLFPSSQTSFALSRSLVATDIARKPNASSVLRPELLAVPLAVGSLALCSFVGLFL